MSILTVEQATNALLSPLGFLKLMQPNWHYNWHHEKVNDALERVFIGQCKRLIINIPPRATKTELAVKAFIPWATGHYPDSKWIHASYSKRLATKNTFEARGYMTHEHYAELFPNVHLRDDGKAKDEFYTTAGGIIYATGAGGTITGYGAGAWRDNGEFGGAIIVDDALKAENSHSETMRENINEWYMSTMNSRLNSPDTPVIVIMQRLHENDLTGFLLNGGSGEEWEHLVIPALNENNQSFWERRFPTERLLEVRTASSMIFAGQYMQQPAPSEGGLYKVKWFENRHDYMSPYNGFERIMLSVDGAFTSKQQNDASAITVWGIKDNNAYLLDCHNVRMDLPDLEKLCVNIYEQHKANGVLVENKASGIPLIPALERRGLSVIEINPVTDKVSRVVQSTTPCEAGRVLLPKYANWLHEVEQQMFFFPNAKHDDIVDSVSQFINWWQGKQGKNINKMYEMYYGE